MLLYRREFGNIMSMYLISCLAGLLISFTGTLPLGNLNVAAMHIAAREGGKRAVWFSLGVSITEMVYLGITLRAINLVIQHNTFISMLQWLSVLFLTVLAIASFIGAAKQEAKAKNIIIDNSANRFLLGAGMGLINPVQFPFWAGWSAYAITQHWVITANAGYNLFTIGAGAGSMAALFLFIYVGKKFAGFMNAHQKQVQLGMGILFLLMALYQLYKIEL